MEADIVPTANSPALLLATEPEAAALVARQHSHLLGLGAGSRFMILDMGGGTVDMTIHEVGPVIGDSMELTEVTYRECLAEVRHRTTDRWLRNVDGQECCLFSE